MRIVEEVENQIRNGQANAWLVDWADTPDLFGENHDPQGTIWTAIAEFQRRGWTLKGNDLVKDGWTLWFRGQGPDNRPIAQWSRRKA